MRFRWGEDEQRNERAFRPKPETSDMEFVRTMWQSVLLPPQSGGITSLEKEVAPKATEDGLPQYEFAEDFL